MDEEEIVEYVDEAQSILEQSPQMDEANTKAAILRDFLDLLGWEIPTNTQLEYSVKVGTRNYRVDYALLLEGAPVAFFEAKGVDTAITEDHREQLATYMKNENVNWGIISNGERYQFLRREVVDSNVSVHILANIELAQLPERSRILRAFTKDAIQAGDSQKIADRIDELKSVRETLEEEKEILAEEVTKIFSNSVSDSISSEVQSQAKEMIDRVIAEIESEIDSDGTVTSDDSDDDLAEYDETKDDLEINRADTPPVPEVNNFKTDTDKRFYKRLKNKPDSQPAVYREVIREEQKISRPEFDKIVEKRGFNPDGGGHNASLLVLERVTNEIERQGRGDNQVLVWTGD